LRRGIGPIVSLGLLLLVHPASAGSAGITSWSQVGRDTTHTAYNPTENVLSPATVPDLVEQWRAELGGDQWSTPVVDGSLVFQTSYENGALSAFDRYTGTLVWQVVLGHNDPFNTPAVADGRVFATGAFSPDLYALDEATGATLWTFRMESSSPAPPSVVTEGGVTTVFAVGGSTVYAVDGATGTVHWSHEFGFVATPAVANGVVYVAEGSLDPALHAHDMETGAEIWAAPLHADRAVTPGHPVLDGGMVFVGLAAGRLFALDQATGAQVWNRDVGVSSHASAANGVVYVHSREVDYPSYLVAIEQATGQPMWRVSLGRSAIYTFSGGASIANGVIYASGVGGWVMALDEVTGSLLWRSRTPNPAKSMPAVVDGMVYAASGNKLFAYGLESEP
jgi:outer membrane protein assembly factor BamB